MIHGKKDEVVPVSFSKFVLSLFKNAKKKLIIVKNGDHSLSNPKQLKIIIKELNNIIEDFYQTLFVGWISKFIIKEFFNFFISTLLESL